DPTTPTDPAVDPTQVVDANPPVDPTPVVDPGPVVPPPTLPTSPVIPTDPVDVTPPPSAPAPVVPAAAAALDMLVRAQAVTTDPALQYKRALFRTLDSDNDGTVSTHEIGSAMIAAGGDKWSAAALNGALDPAGSGMVSQQQFMDRLPTASFDYYDMM